MAEGHANLASAYKDSGHVEAAIKSYKQALVLRPAFPEATCNLLHTLQCVCSWEDCENNFGEVEGIIRRQIKLSILPSVQPFHAIAYPIDLVLALDISRKYAEHCTLIVSRFGLPPFNHPPPIPVKSEGGSGKLVYLYQCVCSWEDHENKFGEVEGIIKRQIKLSVLPIVQPFHAIAYPIDHVLALDISCKYAEHCTLIASCFGLPPFNHPPPIPVKSEGGSGRLRVGYVSSDFGNHPLSHLMGSVFGMHNREHVEIFCYALSQNDDIEWRQHIQAEAEHFIDVSSLSSDIIFKALCTNLVRALEKRELVVLGGLSIINCLVVLGATQA